MRGQGAGRLMLPSSKSDRSDDSRKIWASDICPTPPTSTPQELVVCVHERQHGDRTETFVVVVQGPTIRGFLDGHVLAIQRTHGVRHVPAAPELVGNGLPPLFGPLHLESPYLEGVGDGITDDRQEDADGGK